MSASASGSTSAPNGSGANGNGGESDGDSAEVAAQVMGGGTGTEEFDQSIAQLRKTAELKKHALQLQIHTAHILAAHSALEKSSRTLEDVRAQKNWLESERANLLDKLRKVNEDREKADMLETSINRECGELRAKIQVITDGDYAVAKKHVDELRADLRLPPARPIQSQLDEKSAAYLAQRRLQQQQAQPYFSPAPPTPIQTQQITSTPGPSTSNPTTESTVPRKRGPGRPPKGSQPREDGSYTIFVNAEGQNGHNPNKRPRGRPRGSKNRPKAAGDLST